MHQRGFSLVELLMGLTIAGIVLHLVSPAFAAVMESNYREDAAKSLFNGLRAARTEAITRNQTVLVHAIDGDWRQGWRMILDINGKGDQDSDNPLLFEHQGSARVPVVGNRPVRSYVRFSGLGEPLLPSGAFQAGTLHICSAQEALSQYQVVLARSGRISLRSQKTVQALCTGGEDLEQGTNA